MSPVEEYTISVYRQKEIEALRKAILLWSASTEMPSFVRKEILNADVARNEIKKIEEGKVKL